VALCYGPSEFVYGAKKGISMKNFTTLLAVTALGIVSLGAAACNDDDGVDAASAAPVASPTTGGSVSGTPSASPVAPSASATPRPTRKPSSGQVIMIDPDGKKYTRKWIIRNAMMMAGMSGGLPKNFCAKSYAEGVKGGGRFPAGKGAFMDACAEGVDLAG
jgi:hypothetical protein